MKNFIFITLFAIGNFFDELMKDKEGNFAAREVASLTSLGLICFSFVAETIFGFHVPEYMFFAFVGILGLGKIGYSLERGSGRKRPQFLYPASFQPDYEPLERKGDPEGDSYPVSEDFPPFSK